MTVGGGPAGAGSAMAALIWLTAVMQNEVLVMLALCLAHLRRTAFQRQRLIVKALQIYALATVGFVLFDVVAGVGSPWPEGVADITVLILAGSAAYHLHFFPALMVVVLLIPRSAPNWPWLLVLALAVAAATVRASIEQAILPNPTLSDTALILCLHGLKTLSYLPFALLVLLPRPQHHRWIVLGLVIALVLLAGLSASGSIPGLVLESVRALCAGLAGILICGLPHHSDAKPSPPWLGYLGTMALVVFLIHPVFVTFAGSAFGRLNIVDPLLRTGLTVAFALPASVAIAGLAATIGAAADHRGVDFSDR